jgi:hypothetical protein
VLRQFFSFARSRRLVLVDPTRGLNSKEPRGFRGHPHTGPAAVTVPKMGRRRRAAPARGAGWHARAAARRVQYRDATSDRRRPRPPPPDDPAWQPASPDPSGPRHLAGAAALPCPPRQPAHPQPARTGHPRNQGRTDPGVKGLPIPRTRHLRPPGPDDPQDDIAGANALGIRSIWLSAGRSWTEPTYRPTHITHDAASAIDYMINRAR